jgi:hypothetical protein
MKPRTAFWKWAVLGAVAAGLMLAAQAAAMGGVGGLLQVGANSALRPIIEAELGEVPLAPGPGHDGQIFYAIGVDLQGEMVPGLLDHGAYRYRRVLYPLVASGFGLLDGHALLWGMILVTVVSTAVATGTVAALSRRFDRSDWLALVVLVNPGVWLSIRLLTSDVLALALMVVALATVQLSRGWSTGAFAASVLAKDVYLATPAGLSMSRTRTKWLFTIIPLASLVAWMSLLSLGMGDGFTSRGNLALPFTGIWEGSANWGNLDADEWLDLGFALASVAAGLAYSAIGSGWLRWSILAWSLLGVVSSNWVWDFGNNAARAFAPIVVLIALSARVSAISVPSEAESDALAS